MQPVSGEDLVAAALQSSLARAQKNFKLSYVKQHNQQRHHSGVKTSVNGSESKPFVSPKKFKSLKFQSEFDLWIEQANNLKFTSEGYINGASVPSNIECLNSVNAASLKKYKASRLSKTSVPGTKGCREISGTTSEIGKSEKVTEGVTSLKGKNKSNSAVVTENSFELLKKLKENRKEKKKLAKLRKRLLKEGHSKEETDKLINQAKTSTGGVGAILQKLKQTVLLEKHETEGLSTSKLPLQQKLVGKKLKMRDVENQAQDAATSSSRPNTPPARLASLASPSSSAVNGGNCGSVHNISNNGSSNNNSGNQHQLPQPKRVLYPREKIIPGYIEKLPIGAGFFNMGNSCYLNASLQAVFHVPAFINWLRQDAEHRRHCQDNMNCIVCAMKKTLDSAMSRQNPPPSAIRPVEIINRLRSICRHFSHGRQEDAHEFLRYLFESMERSYLSAINCLRLDNRSKETNPLGQIFGGYLRTEVTCLKCHYVSTTFQPTAELQLDIRHVTTLEDAIMNHFKKERLDNNDYKCEKCRTISQATKQFSLEIPPIVLCLQLKRFTLYGTKIAKRIHCNRYLDMSKFMHKSKQVNGFSNLRYRLVALVTHLGSSPNCGHYTAIAEAANGNFYQFDDSYVHQVTVANALNNDAYVIIYEMDKRTYKSPESSSSSSSMSTSSSYTTNVSNLSFPSSTVTSTNSLFPKKLPSTPIPKISSGATSSPQTSKLVQNSEKVIASNTSSTNGNGNTSSESAQRTPSAIAGNGTFGPGIDRDRKLISFDIRPTPKKITILKPGTSLTNSSKFGTFSPSLGNCATSTSTSTSTRNDTINSERKVKLVPYNDDENEESDNENTRASLPSPKNERLKSPENGKPSPKRSVDELPITPPKSPKPQVALTSSSNSGLTLVGKDLKQNGSETSSKSPTPSTSKQIEHEHKQQKDSAKRKVQLDEEESPRNARRRRSSSSGSSSSRSVSDSPDTRKSDAGSKKRKRMEDANRSVEKKSSTSSQNSSLDHSSTRERNPNNRDSYSQERDRERRRDRNPSPTSNAGKSNTFDLSNLKTSNSILGWDGQKSFLSKSMDEDQKRVNESSLHDDYDDEFDQGRTKKVRRSRSLPRETESGGNKFQYIEDKKKQVEQWSSILDGYGPNFRRGSGSNSSDSKSWTNGVDDSSRHKRNFSSRPSSGGSIGSRPRHSSSSSNNSHSVSNYPKSSHGRRSPYRNGHHSNGGSASQYRSQSHGSYHHHSSNSNKHWNSDRNHRH